MLGLFFSFGSAVMGVMLPLFISEPSFRTHVLCIARNHAAMADGNHGSSLA